MVERPVTYVRRPVTVRVQAAPEGAAQISFGQLTTLVDASALQAPGAVPRLGEELRTGELWAWTGASDQEHPAATPGATQDHDVVELHVDTELAALPWEDLFAGPGHPGTWAPVVRASETPARVSVWPMALPLRFLQVTSGVRDLPQRSDRWFGWRSEHQDLVVMVDAAGPDDVQGWWAGSGWPTADIVELAGDTLAEGVERGEGLRNGTGLLRTVESWCHDLRTRLLVLTPDQADLPPARILAHRLAARGGPAVLVMPPALRPWLDDVYREIVHDRPLDWILWSLRRSSPLPDRPTLVAGTGREELLRVSKVFEPVVELAARLAQPRDEVLPVPSELEDLASAAARQVVTAGHAPVSAPDGASLAERWPAQGEELLEEWDRAVFEDHESDGVVPMQAVLTRMREDLGVAGPFTVAHPDRSAGRFLTPYLGSVDPDGSVTPLPQRGPAPPHRGRLDLSVSVGDADELIRVARAVMLLDEAIFRTADQEGAWLSIGVTGLTCTVVGETTQPLWLPREGPSDRATFRIDPEGRDTWKARVSVYRGNLLLQALLVAGTWVGGPTRRNVRTILARELGITPREVRSSDVWAARVEYTLDDPEAPDADRPARRTLSILANDHHGQSVLRILANGEAAEVRPPGDIADTVAETREVLAGIATPPGRSVYGFADDNSDLGSYERSLMDLADQGWALYESLFPTQESRDLLREALAATAGGNSSVISVGHMLLDKVIPWSLVYDRPFDLRATRDASTGAPVAHVACGAIEAGGDLPSACGTHPACPLHPSEVSHRADRQEPAVEDRTVACPRHFWGFGHIVEMPPHRPSGHTPPTTGVAGGSRAAFGRHGRLVLSERHLTDLRASIETGGGSVSWSEGDRDALKGRLERDVDLDVIYLYCHAQLDGRRKVLRVSDVGADAVEGLLTPADLAGTPFGSHPMVVLNGCRTAGFSPQAISPFVTTLVGGRDAAGLIGTEIDVWEQLAVEMGAGFVTRFLDGKSAGQALRETRLQLLAKRNPLGLAYSMYALSDLHVRP